MKIMENDRLPKTVMEWETEGKKRQTVADMDRWY
jgi:hypothetical protein